MDIRVQIKGFDNLALHFLGCLIVLPSRYLDATSGLYNSEEQVLNCKKIFKLYELFIHMDEYCEDY